MKLDTVEADIELFVQKHEARWHNNVSVIGIQL